MARGSRAMVYRFGPPLLLLGCSFLALGCRRKAPGPEECIAFAELALGARNPAALALDSVQANVDELTTECLLTPYDRELIACVEQTGALRSCQRAFARRHLGVEPVPERLRAPRRRRENPFY
jgi:hypothetical protein